MILQGDPQRVIDIYSHFPVRLQTVHLASFDGTIVYVLGYGGGLVHRDQTSLHATLEQKARCMYLTRGGLKVFGEIAHREDRSETDCSFCEENEASHKRSESALMPGQIASIGHDCTVQRVHYEIKKDAFLMHLPDATTLYKDARFQTHTLIDVQMDGSSSCLCLDWYTSGRPDHDEHWSASLWSSTLLVRLISEDSEPKLYFREAWNGNTSTLLGRAFGVYAALFLMGKETLALQDYFLKLYKEETLYHAQTLQKDENAMIWSCFTLDRHDVTGLLIKVATKEHYKLKDWLHQHLRHNLPCTDIAFLR